MHCYILYQVVMRCFFFVKYQMKIFKVFPLLQCSPKDNVRPDNTVSWQKLVDTPGYKPRLQSSPTSSRNPPASSALITSSGRSRFKTCVKKSVLIISFTCLLALVILNIGNIMFYGDLCL